MIEGIVGLGLISIFRLLEDGGFDLSNGPIEHAVLEITASYLDYLLNNVMKKQPTKDNKVTLDRYVTALAEAQYALCNYRESAT